MYINGFEEWKNLLFKFLEDHRSFLVLIWKSEFGMWNQFTNSEYTPEIYSILPYYSECAFESIANIM